jgi:hypothetical protein
VWVRLNSVAHASTKDPLVAKARAVTTNATQLALNSWVFLIEFMKRRLGFRSYKSIY